MDDFNPSSTGRPVPVLIHPNQFPHAIEAALRESLHTRRMNPKFHYDTAKQMLRWLRVHETFSPARTDPSCLAAYEEAAAVAATAVAKADAVEIVSLGCGAGQKDAQLVRALRRLVPPGRLRVVSVDVSAGLALMARDAAIAASAAPERCVAFVVDLALAEDWRGALGPVLRSGVRRIVTFLGMLPNFTPGCALPRLAGLLGPNDLLLASANLAPGNDYEAGVDRILPLYDNAVTREWLVGVLLDLGVERTDGAMEFRVRRCPEGSALLRIEADFVFQARRAITYGGQDWTFEMGDRFQLFFSYRHQPALVKELFAPLGVEVCRTWTNESGDEGIFLCRLKERRAQPAKTPSDAPLL